MSDTRKSRCLICGKSVAKPYSPFCSKRCADRDLYGWLSGRYAIPTQEAPAEMDPENAEE